MKDDRTFVPVRFVSEALDGEVEWNEKTQQVTIKKAGQEIKIWIGLVKSVVNGITKQNDVAPILKNGRTFVPLRFVSENLGENVEWKEETSTVYIGSSGIQDRVSRYLNMEVKHHFTDFEQAPITEYCPLEHVRNGYKNKAILTTRYVTVDDFPINLGGSTILYELNLETAPNGMEVLSAVMINKRSDISPCIALGNKEDGLLRERYSTDDSSNIRYNIMYKKFEDKEEREVIKEKFNLTSDAYYLGEFKYFTSSCVDEWMAEERYRKENKITSSPNWQDFSIKDVEYIFINTSDSYDTIAVKNPFK
jgi:hypothetical protein